MSELREVVFMSQVWAEAMIPEESESIISITDRGADPADLNEGWHSILRIQFDDVDPDEAESGKFEADLLELTSEQAREIASFVLDTAAESKTLVVHCRFGQSRSPAVAKAICQHFKLDFPSKFNSHNRFVQRLVFDAIAQRSVA